MQLHISGHHLDITAAIRSYVTSKMDRLNRHSDHITQTHVILRLDKPRQIAEAKLHLKGHELFAESQSEDLYASIDALVDKLDRQIIKHKEKKIGQHR